MAGAVSPTGSAQFVPTPRVDYAVRVLHGEQIKPIIPQIIELYLEAFKEDPPYAGEQTLEYQPLLELYAQNNGIACVSFHEGELIGAITGVPLKRMPERFCKPYEAQLDSMFYLGEEVIHKDHRGKSLGTRLYEAFEQEIPGQFNIICFCELIKPGPFAWILSKGFMSSATRLYRAYGKRSALRKPPRTLSSSGRNIR